VLTVERRIADNKYDEQLRRYADTVTAQLGVILARYWCSSM
jgi:hypothetical protein